MEKNVIDHLAKKNQPSQHFYHAVAAQPFVNNHFDISDPEDEP